jgi:pimeloyl-ACP methyl ester carboxylesterase
MSGPSTNLIEPTTVTLPSGIAAHYWRQGTGDPVLYLRSMVIPANDEDFVSRLAEHHDVIIPDFPGFASLEELDELGNGHDLALYFDDLLRALGVERAGLVGHSFGGFVAAEVAAHFPERVAALSLVAPFGLWVEEEPTPDLAQYRPARLFNLLSAGEGHGSGEPAVDEDDEEHIVAAVQAMTAALKFLWPFPDRTFARRLYRITSPTRIYWGREDPINPVGYAARYAAAIRDAEVEVLSGGHLLLQDRPEDMAERIGAFFAAATVPAGAGSGT